MSNNMARRKKNKPVLKWNEQVFNNQLPDSYKELKDLHTNIERISIPKFPYDGKYLMKKGLVEGKKIGLVLK